MDTDMMKLPPKQSRAVIAVLSHPTMGDAAKAAGIGEATLRRWFRRPEFQMAYEQARSDAWVQAIARLRQTATEAVEVLRGIMLDWGKPPSSRVTAARAVLDLSFRALEIEDLERRIAALEAATGKK